MEAIDDQFVLAIDIPNFFVLYVKPSDYDVSKEEMGEIWWDIFTHEFKVQVADYPPAWFHRIRKALVYKMLFLRLVLSVQQEHSKGFEMLVIRHKIINEFIKSKSAVSMPFAPAVVDEDWMCAICLDIVCENVVYFKTCHEFYEKCLLEWVCVSATCPICRS